MAEYNFKLDVFEGPLDLLLHLIEKHKIEICDIPIVEITSQYMVYLDNWNYFDIHYSSEFLVMASTLLQIKSRMLLPKQAPLNSLEEEDPRDELVVKLVEFKAIKELTALIEEKAAHDAVLFTRPEELSQVGIESSYSFDIAHLFSIFHDVYHRKEEVPPPTPKVQVEKETYSLEERMDTFVARTRSGERLVFRRLLQESHNRNELVTIFMAVLELLKRQFIMIDDADETDELILVECQEEPPGLPSESFVDEDVELQYDAYDHGVDVNLKEEDG